MPVDLSVPLSWKNATGDAAVMLDELQPNILKAHVREFLSVLFLNFADQADGRSFLGALVPLMKSARTHLEETTAFTITGVAGIPYSYSLDPAANVKASLSGDPALFYADIPAALFG